jgi:DNA primase
MTYDKETLNAIPIIDVARRLGIQVRGKKAICFNGHDRHTPSLSFEPSRNIWKCFGACGQGGDTIGLVRAKLGYAFPQACKWLAENFHTAVSATHQRPRLAVHVAYERQTAKRKNAKEELACLPDTEVYKWLIDTSDVSAKGNEYLRGRGFRDEIITTFQLRDLVNPEAVIRKAIQKWGFERIRRCGLLRENPSHPSVPPGPLWWDHTMLFPFFEHAEVVYIQGRRLANKGPKYVGLNRIKKPLFNADSLANLEDSRLVLICEGIPDTISAVQGGFNAVGVLGASSFDFSWVEVLSRFRLIVVPDMDEAGEKFAESIQAAFRPVGLVVESTLLPRGKDLSEYLMPIALRPIKPRR